MVVTSWSYALKQAAAGFVPSVSRTGLVTDMSNWFSNFLPFDTEMVYEGIPFDCVETFYQAMKSENKEDWARISKMTASQSKRAGRALVLRPDWDQVKEKFMMQALRHKFDPVTGPHWHAILMSSKNEAIIEWNHWHDTYWGKCTCSRHDGVGSNRLGYLLTQLRTEYQAQLKDLG